MGAQNCPDPFFINDQDPFESFIFFDPDSQLSKTMKYSPVATRTNQTIQPFYFNSKAMFDRYSVINIKYCKVPWSYCWPVSFSIVFPSVVAVVDAELAYFPQP
jgi:hypothetical protein